MQKHYQHLKETEPYWPNDAVYFLTDSTFLHFPYFKTNDQKQIVLDQIIKINKKLGVPISGFSISTNHYHIKFYLEDGLLLKKVKQLLRGGISYEYRRRYKMPYKDMWQTRRVIQVKSEEMNWKVSGYIVGNLLKHKEVSTFKHLKENTFSSYRYMVDKYGEEEMQDLVRNVIGVDEDGLGEIDAEGLSMIRRLKPAEPSPKGG